MNKRKSKRLISILLACLMVVSMFPAAAFADDGNTDARPNTNQSTDMGETKQDGEVAGLPAPDDDGNIVLEKDWTLENDVTLSNSLIIKGDVTIDLNGHNITTDKTITVTGKATLRDSKATTAPVVSEDYKTVTYDSGKINYTGKNTGIIVMEGGIFTLESGTIASKGNGIYANGYMETTDRSPINSTVIMTGGYIHAQEFGIGVAGLGAAVTVNDGVIMTNDNAVVGGNGTLTSKENHGGTTININGGTLIGHITTSGYIACGVYHPQQGTLNISGGTIFADGGVGVLMRAGDANITGGDISATGNVNGKVGDSQIVVGSYGVVFDDRSGYPGKEEKDTVAITGDAKVSGEVGAVTVVPTGDGAEPNTNRVEITGGTFLKGEAADTNVNQYIAPGNEVNESGQVGISKDAVAQIGNKGYNSMQEAIDAAKDGNVTIELLKDTSTDKPIKLSKGVILDGKKHTLTYTGGTSGTPTNGAFITAAEDNVTIKDLTINAGNIKHGVQFYCNKGGKMEKVIVNGGTYTSVIVNGAEAALTECTLNPIGENAYTNIEYAMGEGVANAPKITLDNVIGSTAKPLVYADKNTANRVDPGNTNYEEVANKINDNLKGAEVTLVIVKDDGTIDTENSVVGTKIYTVTFDANGGTVTPSTILTKNDGTLSRSLPTPTYGGGYKFLYWAREDGTKVDATTTFDADTTIKAVWEPPYTGKYSYEITTKVGDNGSIKVDRYATEGEKVTITVTPDEAYLLDELTATSGKKEIELKDNGDGTYTFTMPHGDVKIDATFAEDPDWEKPTPEPEMPFTDVNDGDWFYDVVKYAYNEGLMTGTTKTTFEPNIATTRGMIVSMLARLEGNPTAKSAGFADVADGAWYADAVNWAASEGIVSGYSDTKFGPNDPITREQMAAILYNYAEYKSMDVSARADLDKYTDAASISSWATDVLSWANAEGLVNGMTETTLAPQGQATRAQVAAIFQRFLTK